MYDQREAAEWLETHPNFYPVFQEGYAERGIISLVAFVTDHVAFYEWSFKDVFRVKWRA